MLSGEERKPLFLSGLVCRWMPLACLFVRDIGIFTDFARPALKGARAIFRAFELHQVPRPQITGQEIQLYGVPHRDPRACDEAHGNARRVAARRSYKQ